MGILPNLRFSDNRSFRLFTEGLQALRAYEQNAQRTSLDQAAGKLAECVSNYRDVLPRLYLGIVRYYQGEAVDEAVRLFLEVLDRNIPELNGTARYYLAEAYVSRYTTDDIAHADAILKELLRSADAADQGQVSQLSAVIQLQAKSLQAFIAVRQNLWKRRTSEVDLAQEDQEAKKKLDDFSASLKNSNIPENERRSLQADYWNMCGLLEEYYANKTKDPTQKENRVQESLSNFEKAMSYSPNKADALSNQARVYQELVKDDSKAVRLAKEVLEIRTDDSFAHLLLGRIYEPTRPKIAIEHYRKAQAKFPGEANYRAGVILQRLDRKEEARESFRRVPKSDKSYNEKAQDALKSLDGKQPATP